MEILNGPIRAKQVNGRYSVIGVYTDTIVVKKKGCDLFGVRKGI